MSAPGDPGSVRDRVRAAEEEVRYRAARELDAAAPDARALLLGLLGDPSWRVRSAAVERLVTTGLVAEVLPPLLAALSGGASVGVRDAAGVALSRLAGEAVLPLVARLDGPDADLRQAAASVLGAIGDRRAVVPLAARLADPDSNVRAAAAEALGKIGGPEAGATLLAALDSDEQTLKLSALEALLAMRLCPPAARLAPLLADRSLRLPTYRALGWCDEEEAGPLLARGLSETSRTAREAALAGVGAQRTRRHAADLRAVSEAVAEAARGGLDLRPCVESLDAEDVAVAVGALSVLGWGGVVSTVGAMLRRAEDDRLRPFVEESVESLPKGPGLREAIADALEDQGPFGRIAALALLARLGSPAALESLVREASDPSGYLQAEAIAALGHLGDARAVPPLAGLLGDDAPAVSGIAATALVRIGQESAEGCAAALAVLRDRSATSPSASLLRVLGALGSAQDLPRLRAGLRRPAVVQRMAAAGALSSLAQRGMVADEELPELVTALADEAWSVRAAAARAFIELARASREAHSPRPDPVGGHPPPAQGERPPSPSAGAAAAGEGGPLSGAAVQALTRALDDPEPAVRAVAVEALGATGVPGHAPAIAALARAPDVPPILVLAALRALVALGRPPADVISRAAAHADPEVVKEAVAAAARLPGMEGELLLHQAAENPRWDIRQAAARAMLERGDPALGSAAEALADREVDPLVARAFAEAARALSGR